MSKLTKIIFLFVVLFALCFNFTYATNITENEENEATITSETESVENTETDESSNQYSETASEQEQTNSFDFNNSAVTSVSTISSYSEANLGLNNILNIILIAIGVLIILFAIAILIRLKQ